MAITFPCIGPSYDQICPFVKETKQIPPTYDTRIQVQTYGPYADFRHEFLSFPEETIQPFNLTGPTWGIRTFRGFLENHQGIWKAQELPEHSTDGKMMSRLQLRGIQVYPFDEYLAGTERTLLFMSTNHPLPTYLSTGKTMLHNGWILQISRIASLKQIIYSDLPTLLPDLINLVIEYHDYHFDITSPKPVTPAIEATVRERNATSSRIKSLINKIRASANKNCFVCVRRHLPLEQPLPAPLDLGS
jgi:hypothetical protein